MSYINETDFVIENKELVYPEIVTDGLQLYYDAKGKRDTDYHRDTMLDMSGNKNHGKLHNFAYEKHSGYKDGLVFDYIDDKLVRPTLNLQPNDFTFMLNGNIISFSPDGTVKRVQDGEVIESKGFNMLYDMEGASQYGLDVKYNYNHAQAKWIDSSNGNTFLYSTTKYNYKDKHKYYISYNAKPDGPVRLRIYANERYLDGDILNPILNEYNFRSGIIEAESQYGNHFNIRLLFATDNVIGTKVEVKDLMMIDLTDTFSEGSEPTKEQMDEIIQRFGFIPNTQDLIDRIEYKGNDLGDMENIIDGLYKTEILSGEEIYTNEADDSVVHVEVDGKSYQHAGSGKNLFNINMIDESIASAGSTVGAPIKLKPNTTYTLSTNAIPDSVLRDVFFDINRTAPSSGTNGVNTDGVTTITTDSSGDAVVWVRARNSTNEYNLNDFIGGRNWIQIEEGSVATEYEPPAPTPDYPIDIHSLNDFDVVSSVGKRNLIPKYTSQKWSHHGTTEVLEYQLVFPPGTYGNSIIFLDIEPNVNYTVTFSSENARYYIYEVIDGEIGDIVRVSANSDSYTFNSGDLTQIRISLNSYSGNVDLQKVISALKLEKNSTITEWNPAPEDIPYDNLQDGLYKINLLLDEPLRSVGDVKDRLFRDSDGAWKIERNIAIVSVVDISAWTNVSDRYQTATTSQIGGTPSVIAKRGSQPISSHFQTGAHAGAGDAVGLPIVGNFPQFRIKFNNNVIGVKPDSTTEERIEIMRNWINNNSNAIIQYERDEKIVEILPQFLQDKLNNLRSFEDSNYVYTVLPNENNALSENLKPTLHAKFLYNDWYKEDRVINNLMIYNRALTNEEMLQNYKTIKRRWGM